PALHLPTASRTRRPPLLKGAPMRYLALATDYDGTLAHDGRVDRTTLAALGRLRRSGRRLILVTGREADDLLNLFDADPFDGVGDAENDHAFLAYCERGVAVANALPALKEMADLVTRADHGAGVVELIDHLLADDLAGVGPGEHRRKKIEGDIPRA